MRVGRTLGDGICISELWERCIVVHATSRGVVGRGARFLGIDLWWLRQLQEVLSRSEKGRWREMEMEMGRHEARSKAQICADIDVFLRERKIIKCLDSFEASNRFPRPTCSVVVRALLHHLLASHQSFSGIQLSLLQSGISKVCLLLLVIVMAASPCS